MTLTITLILTLISTLVLTLTLTGVCSRVDDLYELHDPNHNANPNLVVLCVLCACVCGVCAPGAANSTACMPLTITLN